MTFGLSGQSHLLDKPDFVLVAPRLRGDALAWRSAPGKSVIPVSVTPFPRCNGMVWRAAPDKTVRKR